MVNAGWHYSFMMQSDQIAHKLRSFSHQELDIESIVDNLDVPTQVGTKQDILGRSHVEWCILTESEVQLPDYVKHNLDRFNRYLFKC
jgi:hypothetical protein